ncbi:MAG TPA: vWA domain-containing protein [Streptosporangiaceae bacterium]|nr:vWA domain-containing protein [Streptosporangiaceae bacterium]
MAVAILIDSPTIKTFFSRTGAVSWAAVRWAAFGAPGIAGALIVFLLATNVWSAVTRDSSCAEPVDLRVTTAPEDVVPLTEAARRYVAEKSRRGCRAASITVTGNSSIGQLEKGFVNGWTSQGTALDDSDCAHLQARVTLLGPQPDIWIPSSRALAETVQAALEEPADPKERDECSREAHPVRAKAHLDIHESIGSSPMVVGVFADFNRRELGGVPGEQRLAALLSTFSDKQVLDSVTRTSADTSESALLATPVLYQALREAKWVDDGKMAPERLLDQGGTSAGDAASLLCQFRDDDAHGRTPPTEGTAVIVPESVLARYDHGDDLGEEAACQGRVPSPKWRLYPYYTADLPVIEHPFVHVRWPGEDTASRDRAVEEFRAWLADGELTNEGLRTAAGTFPDDAVRLRGLRKDGQDIPDAMPPHPLRGDPGCVESLEQVRTCYNEARPMDPLTLLLDVSGSMANPGPKGGQRLARAQEVAQSVAANVRPETTISFYPFSTAALPETERVISSDNDDARENVLGAIQREVPAGQDLPLATAVEQTAARLLRGTQTIVLLTDAQQVNDTPATRARDADQARALAERLEKYRGLRLLIVPTGPPDCRAPRIALIIDAFRDRGTAACVGSPQDALDDLASAVVSKVLWG